MSDPQQDLSEFLFNNGIIMDRAPFFDDVYVNPSGAAARAILEHLRLNGWIRSIDERNTALGLH